MLHSISRVVVVSVVALSLNIAVAPAVHAKPHESATTMAKGASRAWMEEAMNLVNRLLGKDNTTPQGLKKKTGNSGPCIDPMGNPKPCP